MFGVPLQNVIEAAAGLIELFLIQVNQTELKIRFGLQRLKLN